MHPPINVHQLPEHLERLKANDSARFSVEFESLERPNYQFDHSTFDYNKPKNRFANIIAFDHSRVKLHQIEGLPGSDYINANFIDGYRRRSAYIATQGPLPETFGDFWRMVWEQRTPAIVMMTKLEERGVAKCDQYWPSRGTELYDLMQVSLVDCIEFAHFVLRTFHISYVSFNCPFSNSLY